MIRPFTQKRRKLSERFTKTPKTVWTVHTKWPKTALPAESTLTVIEVIVIRHPKEKLSKCSLEPLRAREGIRFFKAHRDFRFDATGYVLLSVDAPEITHEDSGHPLLLLDSTWRLLPRLEACLTGDPIRRSLPKWIKTAYPRVSQLTPDPLHGLASVEALYAAMKHLGEDDLSLLDSYYWRDAFLRQFS